jgi:hypothetical protein
VGDPVRALKGLIHHFIGEFKSFPELIRKIVSHGVV